MREIEGSGLLLSQRSHASGTTRFASKGAVAISNGPTIKDALDKGIRYEQTLGF